MHQRNFESRQRHPVSDDTSSMMEEDVDAEEFIKRLERAT
jgi:hypothetical protein